MKKFNVSILLAIFAIAFVVLGCNKTRVDHAVTTQPGISTNALTYNSFDEYRNAIDEVGVNHNNCMQYVHTSIITTYGSLWQDLSQGDKESFITSEISTFFSNLNMDMSAYTSLTYDRDYIVDSTSLSDSAYYYYTAAQQYGEQYLDGLINEPDFNIYCEDLKTRAYTLIDENESIVIGIGIAVTQNSFKLWKNNYTNYCADFQIPIPEPQYLSKRQAEVGGADLKGAIRGGIFGCAGGGVGIILGASWGACTSSFMEAIF